MVLITLYFRSSISAPPHPPEPTPSHVQTTTVKMQITGNATTVPSSISNIRQHHYARVTYPYVVYCCCLLCATYSSTAVQQHAYSSKPMAWFRSCSNFARQSKFVSSRGRFLIGRSKQFRVIFLDSKKRTDVDIYICADAP